MSGTTGSVGVAMTPLYVKVSRAPEVFDIARSTIYRLAGRGEITIHKRGGSAFLSVAEMQKWIEGKKEGERK